MATKCMTVLSLIAVVAMAANGAILFRPGERVVLLHDDPPAGLGLKAGRSGTVLCCDVNDCSGDILVSWDSWADARADTSLCLGGMNALYPANSAMWIDPNRVRIGHLFKQCGTIRKGLEGCVYLEADDAKLYNIVSSGSLHSALSATAGAIHFNQRVQVQGLLNTTPPGEIRLCPQLDGDIFHPIVSACPGSSAGVPDPITIGLGGNPLQLVLDPNSSAPGWTYNGCTSVTLELNFQAKLFVKVTPAPGVSGTWTGTVTPDVVGPGTVTVQICVHVEHLDIGTLPVGNMQVASVTLSAAPAM
jgi:hypothetical protein